MDFVKDIIAQAWAKPDQEICGLVIQRAEGMLESFPAKNIHASGQHFAIDPAEVVAAEKLGRVLAIYHSHPFDPAVPSDFDKACSDELKLPYYIFSLVDQKFMAYVPPTMQRDPIEGRPYLPLIYSCVTLCHDYLTQVQNISLTPLEMEYNEDAMMNPKFAEYILSNGFERVSTPQEGDVILMNVHEARVDHAAIYLGDKMMLHHCLGKRSEKAVYGGLWKKSTCHILRHKSLLK